MEIKDISGQRFYRWTAQPQSSRTGRCLKWLCRCDCGTERWIVGSELRRGQSKGCGCLAREMTGVRRRTHGRTGTAEYRCWLGVIQRCTTLKGEDFRNYGAR